MKNFRSTLLSALAAALIAFIVSPTTANAQDDGRFVVVLDVSGKKSGKISSSVFDALSEGSHIVFSETEFVEMGDRNGAGEANFWDQPDLMARVAQAENVDALVVPTLTRDRKKYRLEIIVFEARTGEIVGDFNVELGKKPRVKGSHADTIRDEANALIAQTGLSVAPQSVSIRVTSVPPGATVLREGKPVGTTPVNVDVEYAEVEEVWELTWQDQPAGVVRVDLAKDGAYDVTLPEELVGDLGGEGDDPDEPSGPRRFDGATGGARPLLEITAGVDLTSRDLSVTVDDGDGLSYGSSLYPVFVADLVFYPFVLFSKNDYLGGIGLTGGGGFGSLDSRIPLISGGNAFDPDGECAAPDANGFINCPTTHTQFYIGAIYTLLLQDAPDGAGLNADGMALGLDVSYSWLVFDVASNPTYEGHGYQGLRMHLTFDTPLVLEELRLAVGFAFTPMLSFGDADMIEDWGEKASGIGIGGDLDFTYDVWEGLIVGADTNIAWQSTSYEGTGCQDVQCTIPTGSASSDLFFQAALKVGYRLQ